jgi:hypothetical protein
VRLCGRSDVRAHPNSCPFTGRECAAFGAPLRFKQSRFKRRGAGSAPTSQPPRADQRPAQELVNSCFGERVDTDIDRGSGEQNGLSRRDLMDVQTRSTGTANTYPTPRSVWMTRGVLGSRSSLRRRRRICTSMLRSKTSSCTRVDCSRCSRLSGRCGASRKAINRAYSPRWEPQRRHDHHRHVNGLSLRASGNSSSGYHLALSIACGGWEVLLARCLLHSVRGRATTGAAAFT